MSNRTILRGVLVFVVVVWGASMIATFISPAYRPPEGATGVITGIAGAVIYALGKTDKDDDNHTPPGTSGGGST